MGLGQGVGKCVGKGGTTNLLGVQIANINKNEKCIGKQRKSCPQKALDSSCERGKARRIFGRGCGSGKILGVLINFSAQHLPSILKYCVC